MTIERWDHLEYFLEKDIIPKLADQGEYRVGYTAEDKKTSFRKVELGAIVHGKEGVMPLVREYIDKLIDDNEVILYSIMIAVMDGCRVVKIHRMDYSWPLGRAGWGGQRTWQYHSNSFDL